MEITLRELRPTIRKTEASIADSIDDLVSIDDCDTVREWFSVLIDKKPAACVALGLPRSRALEAFEDLLRSGAEVSWTVSRLLAQRLSIYLALIPEISTHPFAGSRIRELDRKISPLEALIRRGGPAPRIRSVGLVAQGLKANELSGFKESLVDTDLWVVLKALYEDKSTVASDRRVLYDYVFDCLTRELRHPGSIPQERHAWWAVVTLVKVKYDGLNDVRGRNTYLQAFVRTLLRRPEPLQGVVEHIIRSSPVPELHSDQREQLLIGSNLCYLLSIPSEILGKDIRDQLRSRLIKSAHQINSNDTFEPLKTACTRLWFAYDFAQFLTVEETEKLLAANHFDWEAHRVGTNYYDSEVVAQVAPMLERAKNFIKRPATWTSPTLTAGLVCGGPGQGKTELMRQLAGTLCSFVEPGKCLVHFKTIGNDIKTERELVRFLAALKAGVIHVVLIDEIDKANFNLARIFLKPLESVSADEPFARTFWIFGQSSYDTLDDYKAAAQQRFESEHDASVRDFLTRLKWGSIEIPDIRFLPCQRVLSAFGMVRTAGFDAAAISKRWVRTLGLDTRIGNNRELRERVLEISDVSDGALDVKTNARGTFKSRRDAATAWQNVPGT